MTINKEIIKNKDGSVTLEIDLSSYLNVFYKINTQGEAASPVVKKLFDELHEKLWNMNAEFLGSALFNEMLEKALEKYPETTQEEIQNSPACSLLHDSGREIIKNTIDVFLENHLKHNDRQTTLQLNLNIEDLGDKVQVTFSDNGAGFNDVNQWSNEQKQLAYVSKHTYSQKKDNQVRGLLGGGGFGIRHLIHQILIGTTLSHRTQPIRPKNYEASMTFANGIGVLKGAAIQITTQKRPLILDNNRDVGNFSPISISPVTSEESHSPMTSPVARPIAPHSPAASKARFFSSTSPKANRSPTPPTSEDSDDDFFSLPSDKRNGKK